MYEATAWFGTGASSQQPVFVMGLLSRCEPDSESQSTGPGRPPGFGLIMARACGPVRTRMLKVLPTP